MMVLYLSNENYKNVNYFTLLDPIVFEGALIVIITIDLRVPETAYSAFSRWTELREKHMEESFLFVVGNFLDSSIERRIEISEITKACAKKEAIYIEVSNITGVNIALFRSILAHRVSQILLKRSELFSNIVKTENESKISKTELYEFDADNDMISSSNNPLKITGPVNAPFIEQDLMFGSVGSLLASCMGTEAWPGYENEKEDLKNIGNHIMDFIDRMSTDDKSVPAQPLEYLFSGSKDYNKGSKENVISQKEIEDAFKIMGFKLPPAMLTSNPTSPTVIKKQKIKITLPSGESKNLVLYEGYNVEDQVDSFLKTYNLTKDVVARERILSIAKTVSKKNNVESPDFNKKVNRSSMR